VDDGSTDATLAIAREFTSPVVKVVGQEKQSAAAARNYALGLSQGDYIQWLDADDVLAPDKIERQIAVALGNYCSESTLLSGPWGDFIYRKSKARFMPTALWCDLAPQEWLLRKMGQNLHMQTATWLVHRGLTTAAGPWDTRLSLDDDGEYFCRVLLASTGTRFVPAAKVYYRAARPTSLRNVDGSRKKLESYVLSTTLHVKYVRSLGESERVRSACVRYLQRRLHYVFPEYPDLVQQLEALAGDLGGRLEQPRIGGRYSAVETFFGYGAAKRLRSQLRRSKSGLIRLWDRILSRLERTDNEEQSKACASSFS
jgi:glycosyltransferase involved in cell wall biosynthesis